jgi:hypothetical protein
MKVRTSNIAAGAALVLGATGALVLPAVASAHSSRHTLKFTSVTQAGLAAPAMASAVPYVDAHATGWSSPRIRPTFITVGNGCAPQEHYLKWSSWGTYTASGTSSKVLFPPACSPQAGTMYLGRPRLHNGQEYFTRMTMRSSVGTLRFQLDSNGYWNQS